MVHLHTIFLLSVICTSFFVTCGADGQVIDPNGEGVVVLCHPGTFGGVMRKDAFTYALFKINEDNSILGNYTFVASVHDIQRNPKFAVLAALGAASDSDLIAFVGPYTSQATLSTQAIARSFLTPMITPGSTYSGFLDRDVYPFVTTVVPSNKDIALGMAYIAASLGFTETIVMYSDDIYGSDGSAMFMESAVGCGIKVSGNFSFPATLDATKNMTNYKTQLVSAMVSGVKVITFFANDIQMTQILEDAVDLGMLSSTGIVEDHLYTFIGSDGVMQESIWHDNAKATAGANGMIGIVPHANGGNFTGWSAEFRSVFGYSSDTEVNAYAAFTYDSVFLLAHAIDQMLKAEPNVTHTTLELNDWIQKTNFTGVTGLVSGNRSQWKENVAFCVFNVQNGNNVHVGEYSNRLFINYTAPVYVANQMDPIDSSRMFSYFNIGGLFPLSGTNGTELCPSCAIAFRLAIAKLNFDDNELLWDTFIHSYIKDVQNSKKLAVDATREIIDDQALSFIGCDSEPLSVVAQAIGSIAGVVQLSYAATTAELCDSRAFPFFVRVVPSSLAQDSILEYIPVQFGWDAMTVLSEGSDYSSLGSTDVIQECLDFYDVPMGHTTIDLKKGPERTAAIDSELDSLRARGKFIFMLYAELDFTLEFLERALLKGMIASQYAWILSQSVFELDLDCEKNASLCEMLDGSLSPRIADFDNLDVYRTIWEERDPVLYPCPGCECDLIGAYTYDAVFALARALTQVCRNANQTRSCSLPGTSLKGQVLYDALLNGSFIGITDYVSFDETGDRAASYSLWNFQKDRWVEVGKYDHVHKLVLNDSSPILWHGGSTVVPADHVTKVYLGVPSWLSILLICLVVFLSINVCGMGSFVFCHRKNDVIRRSNRLFSYLVLFSAFVSYFSSFSLAMQRDFVGSNVWATFFCNTYLWCGGIGFILMYSSIFVKTYALAKIFRNKKVVSVVVTKWQLVRFVSFFVTVEILLLVLQTIFATPKSVVVESGNEWAYSCGDYGVKGTLFTALHLAYRVIIIIYGVLQTFRARNVADTYREARVISYVIYNFLFSTVFFTFFAFFFRSPLVSFCVGGAYSLWLVSSTIWLIFTPKVVSVEKRLIYRRLGIDKEQLAKKRREKLGDDRAARYRRKGKKGEENGVEMEREGLEDYEDGGSGDGGRRESATEPLLAEARLGPEQLSFDPEPPPIEEEAEMEAIDDIPELPMSVLSV